MAPKAKAKPKYNAQDLRNALATRHGKDVFVPECKDGPTWGSTHLRLDAWAMKRSWSNPCAWGYEIKVSRADFVQDDKWPGYLPYCNEFYFVAPRGLIDPSELSPEVGLMVASGQGPGMRLLTVKRAQYRRLEIPEEFYQYILMCRVVVDKPNQFVKTREERAEFWKSWAEQEREFREIGYQVSRKIKFHVEEVERENDRLISKMATYDHLKEMLRCAGIDPDSQWDIENKFQARLKATNQVFDADTIEAMQRAYFALDTALAKVKEQGTEQAA